MKFVVAFLSPAGSTRKVGKAILESLEDSSQGALWIDMDKEKDGLARIVNYISCEPFCIFVGTPVYKDVTTAPVLSLLKDLAPVQRSYAVPFCTWGGAASGIAIYQMAEKLLEKGFIIPAAARVIAVHSMLRLTDDPLGKGHPDDEDLKAIKRMTCFVVDSVLSGSDKGLELHALDYPNPELSAEMKKKVNVPIQVTPKKVNEEACSECGLCVSECPVGAIELSPKPKFKDTCIDCHNCFQVCPEDAIIIPITREQLNQMIRKRSKTINESPVTTVIYP